MSLRVFVGVGLCGGGQAEIDWFCFESVLGTQ